MFSGKVEKERESLNIIEHSNTIERVKAEEKKLKF